MPFSKDLPVWAKTGTKPPDSVLNTTGWKAGDKPPADWLNWFQSTAFFALQELQQKAIHEDQKGVNNGVASLGPDGKLLESQRPPVTPVVDGTTTKKGIVQLNDTTNSTLTTQAATANSVKKVNDSVVTHSTDTTLHITATERTRWNNPETTASKITVADTANLFASTDVEGVLKELFTNANDGKTRVANSVTTKGVSASPSDTFSTLAVKIGQIDTGVKVASGTSVYTDDISYGGYLQTVSGLNFTPDMIIAWNPSSSNKYPSQIAGYVDLSVIKSLSLKDNGNMLSGEEGKEVIFNVFTNGFTLRSLSRTSNTGDVWNWIAFKVKK